MIDRAYRAAAAMMPGGRLLRPLPVGATSNRQYLVRSNDRTYVLRCCRRCPDPSRLDFISGIGRALIDCGLPASEPDCLWHDGTDYWQLSRWLPGTHFRYDRPRQLEAAGTTLGLLHSNSPQLLRLAGTPIPHDVQLVSWRYPLDQIDRTASMVSPSIRPLVHRFSPLAVQACTSVELELGLCLTHGDWHGLNLLFVGDTLSGICDLDAVDIRPRAYDVATGLLMLCRTGRGDHLLCPERMRLFVDAYADAAGALLPGEREAIPGLMMVSQLPDAGHLCALVRDGSRVKSELADQFRTVTRIRDQIDVIRRTLS